MMLEHEKIQSHKGCLGDNQDHEDYTETTNTMMILNSLNSKYLAIGSCSSSDGEPSVNCNCCDCSSSNKNIGALEKIGIVSIVYQNETYLA